MIGSNMEDLRRRYGDLAAEDVARLDAAAVQSGVGVLQLMEVAGWQVARCAWRLLYRRPGRVTVVAGRGNNGGDGAVAARHLAAWGCDVMILLAGSAAAMKDPLAAHLDSARSNGVRVTDCPEPDGITAAVGTAANDSTLLLDALLGTGLTGAPRELDAAAISAMQGAPVLAVDVPSGLDASTGESHGACVTALATCTLTAMKRGLWTTSGQACSGTVYVADIGMPPSAWAAAGIAAPTAVRGGGLVRLPDLHDRRVRATP
jgi:ADP-dependent NAD(P)H-hydrate dehydratase / NAD(P)H-hydrate epimerase